MWADNFWKAKELYKDISKAIPGFENLEPGQSISIKDQEGNLAYKISTVKVGTPMENIEKGVGGIVVNGKPNSVMTMATRGAVYLGATSLYKLMDVFFKEVLDRDLEADQKYDFDLHLQDIKAGTSHQFRGNHVQSKLEELLPALVVDFDKEGNVTKQKGLHSSADPHQALTSEEFKSNFTSLHQNIKS